MSKGAELIAAERERQVTEEGWTPEHDAQWTEDELAQAGACYATGDTDLWPWDWAWYKPKKGEVVGGHILDLVKAGALIAAEIDRLNAESPGEQPQSPARPAVVCLCGSTRFVDTFNEWRQRLTLEGAIVLSIEIVTTQSREQDPQYADPEAKARLDELHKRKIDLADEVLILNVGGYIGSSTRSELEYAEAHGKGIRYLEPVKP